MRISDWSSDVCSSDLLAIIRDPDVAVFAVVDGRRIEVGMLELDFRHPGQCELSYVGLVPDLAGQGHGSWLMAHAQIGRASWRERVCPYVLISVVAVSLKKNKTLKQKMQ